MVQKDVRMTEQHITSLSLSGRAVLNIYPTHVNAAADVVDAAADTHICKLSSISGTQIKGKDFYYQFSNSLV